MSQDNMTPCGREKSDGLVPHRFVPTNEDESYETDVWRIVGALAECGMAVSPRDAKLAWEAYSDSMAAGWMFVPDDPSDIRSAVIGYFAPC